MYFFSLRCDADPVALTKYVLALIKKDKAETELRDSMEQQMEVFLQENTAEFIDSLFKTLSDKEYLNGPPKIAKRNNSDDEDDVQDGKPDSTTSTPANVGELSSELKDTDVQKPRRISEVCKIKNFCRFEFFKTFYRIGKSVKTRKLTNRFSTIWPGTIADTSPKIIRTSWEI